MKVPKVKLPPQYRFSKDFGKRNRPRKQRKYRVVNSSIRVKNSDIEPKTIEARELKFFVTDKNGNEIEIKTMDISKLEARRNDHE